MWGGQAARWWVSSRALHSESFSSWRLREKGTSGQRVVEGYTVPLFLELLCILQGLGPGQLSMAGWTKQGSLFKCQRTPFWAPDAKPQTP